MVDHDEISDDEALRLLAEMDAPAEDAPSAAPAAASSPAAATPGASGPMSDDEAHRLLEAMDSPLPEDNEGAGPAPVAAKVLSADEEAEALMRQLGGGGDEEDTGAASSPPPAPAKSAPPPKAAVSPTPPAKKAQEPAPPASGGEEDAEVGEIPEWRESEFQSDANMLGEFLTSADEIMTLLDEKILELEQNPDGKEIIEEIFRAAHTLKGTAGMFGFAALERVMHKMENLFDNVRKGKLRPDSSSIDVVFKGMDVMRALMQAVKDGSPCGIKTAPIVKLLVLAAAGRASEGGPSGGATAPAVDDAHASAQSHDDGAGGGGAGAGPKSGGGQKKKAEQSTIRVDLERLDALVNLIGELVIDRTRFVAIEEDLRTNHAQLKLAGNMTETVQLFGRHMNEIQDIIMKVRMVPIGNAFNKFTRVVRDLARSLDKKIELTIVGEETELDKTLVEMIGDPLIHLIRNSCDHGIELPADRQRAGKSPTGRIVLSASQEGNHIVISIQDDGKGIPVDRIKKKALEKGLIKETDALSEKDILNLIFEPGFSTAEKVTTVSGRGVGMDVVRKQIAKLKGMIEIESVPGKGTTMTIQLPLTLAIVQSLLVEAGDDVFAIPQSAIVESIRITPETVQRVGDAEVITLRNRVLPLVHLRDVLNLELKKDHFWYNTKSQAEGDMQSSSRRSARQKDRIFVVIVGSSERRFGIVVDQLLTQQEMVIKPMGPMLKGISCIAGGAVLGNGEVVLAVDIADLQHAVRARARGQQQAA